MNNWNQQIKPKTWLEACVQLNQQQQAYCLATVLAEVGSVPRANGAKMVISETEQFDTLGGGQLEFEVIKHARQQLTKGQSHSQIERFSLAADLAQCCGGAVQVLFEYFLVEQASVVIYGAGHVSHSLCQILSQLPLHVTVVDNRQEWLDSIAKLGVNTLYQQQPELSVSQLKANSHVLILTQDHGIDFAVSLAALERSDLAMVGLIGSATKAQRFRYRLKEQLSDPSLSEKLVCPLGLPQIKGKLPMQVAVSISGQLLEKLQQLTTSTAEQSEQHKKQLWQASNQLRQQLEMGESHD